MNKKRYQKGSAHLIILIILVIALLGALGFIFWQKFSADKDDKKPNSTTLTTNITTTIASEVELSEIAYDKTTNSGLAIKYPSSWIVNNTTNIPDVAGQIMSDSTVITSPDGNVSIEYNVTNANAGMGGTCVADGGQEGAEVTELIQLDVDLVPNYQNTRFASFIEHNSYNDKYSYGAGAQDTTTYVSDIKNGDKTMHCSNFGIIPFFLLINNNSPDYEMTIVKLSIKLIDIDGKTNPTLDEIMSSMESDNYKVAKRIVQSLYVK